MSKSDDFVALQNVILEAIEERKKLYEQYKDDDEPEYSLKETYTHEISVLQDILRESLNIRPPVVKVVRS